MATGAELRPGDRVRLIEDYPAMELKAGHEGTVREVEECDKTETSLIGVHWDGCDYDTSIHAWARRMEKIADAEDSDEDEPEMLFAVGDKVLLNLEEYNEEIECELGYDDDAEKRYYLQFEVVDLDPGDTKGWNVQVTDAEGEKWWLNQDWLVEATFDPEESPLQAGDTVMMWKPDAGGYHKTVAPVISCQREDEDAKESNWWLQWPTGGRKHGRRKFFLILKRARQFKAGDVVRVKEGTVGELAGFNVPRGDAEKMQGVVFKVMEVVQQRVNGHEFAAHYQLDAADVVGASQNWYVEAHCVAEARASEYKSSAPAGKAAAPKAASTKIKPGDKVKVIAKVSDLRQRITSDIIMAARMKGKVCSVDRTDNSPPNIYVKFPDGMGLWLYKEMLEKVE